MNQIIEIPLIINDLPVNAKFNLDNQQNIFLPLLKKLDELQKQKNRRIIVLMAAAGGCGKSTLNAYLQQLSMKYEDIQQVQAVSMDGFHHYNSYLQTHHINNDKNLPLLKSIKGAISTFDIDKLSNYILKAKCEDIIWPIYSRKLHDVNDNGVKINANIVIIEGLYLLVNENKWKNLKQLADYSIFIDCDQEQLQKHIVARKIMGGYSYQEAYNHYLNSDLVNAQLINNNSQEADLHLHVDANMNYQIIKDNYNYLNCK